MFDFHNFKNVYLKSGWGGGREGEEELLTAIESRYNQKRKKNLVIGSVQSFFSLFLYLRGVHF